MIFIYGLGLLGHITAACLASWGKQVTLMYDETLPSPPAEPGLEYRLGQGREAHRLHSARVDTGVERASDVGWLTFDTPVDAQGNADVAWVQAQCDRILRNLPAGMLVLLSSQIPVGFTSALAQRWPLIHIAVAPENIRRGHGLADFFNGVPVVGLPPEGDLRPDISRVFQHGMQKARILWMSRQSAELAKQARNAFLAMSIVFAHEVALVADAAGADYTEIEQALKDDPRIGEYAYIGPGRADGRHMLRDVRYLLKSMPNENTLNLMQQITESDTWAP